MSRKQARRLAIRAQRLDGCPAPTDGSTAVLQIIQQLGYVQIDTISVVERAHHHTLWTRFPTYTPEVLHTLQAEDRSVFEYWTHALSVVPMSDYAYYRHQMDRFRNDGGTWTRAWRAEHRELMGYVLKRIRAEGPLTSKDFAPPPGHKRGTWWNWKPAKIALEVLFRQGDLMIAERRSFQKVYDLAERVLPDGVDATAPSSGQRAAFQVRRALAAHGVIGERGIADMLCVADKRAVSGVLKRLTASGEVVRVQVENIDLPWYALAETTEAVDAPESAGSVYLLSPFDSLIIQRQRMQRLFDFAYTLECYLPAEKRTHGYFVLPILWQDRLIARVDPKADRETGTLQLKRLLFEPGFSEYDDVMESLAAAFSRFARFNGCHGVRLEHVVPARAGQALRTAMKRAMDLIQREEDDGS